MMEKIIIFMYKFFLGHMPKLFVRKYLGSENSAIRKKKYLYLSLAKVTPGSLGGRHQGHLAGIAGGGSGRAGNVGFHILQFAELQISPDLQVQQNRSGMLGWLYGRGDSWILKGAAPGTLGRYSRNCRARNVVFHLLQIAKLQISPDLQVQQKKIWNAQYLGGCSTEVTPGSLSGRHQGHLVGIAGRADRNMLIFTYYKLPNIAIFGLN